MLDFKFKFRWGRFAYIGAIAAVLGYFFTPWAGLICLLAIIDVRLDDNVFHSEEFEEEADVITDENGDPVNDENGGPYGPSISVYEHTPTTDAGAVGPSPTTGKHMG